MNYEEIRVSSADRTATVTLNRPDRLNAWTSLMASEVRHAVGEAGRDPEVRCIIVTGEGRGFCAGADMDTLDSTAERGGVTDGNENFLLDDVTYPNAPGPDLGDRYPGHFGYFYSCPKPIVAQINGPCAGIGLVLSLYADLRFAADDARLTTSFAARGLVAEHGIAWLLPRLIGEARALDLLFTARKFSGAEAETIGLVNKALPADALSAHVSEVARVFAQDVSPRSVAVMKRQVRAAHFQSFAESLAVADAEMEQSFSAPDFKEGIGSFVQRRAPAFPGV